MPREMRPSGRPWMSTRSGWTPSSVWTPEADAEDILQMGSRVLLTMVGGRTVYGSFGWNDR
jgi:hypothetical protein